MLLELRHDGPLSNFAFNFNLRCYNKGQLCGGDVAFWGESLVGRCRLTVSKPMLKALIVSALETRIS